jgi:hypothetical protein
MNPQDLAIVEFYFERPSTGDAKAASSECDLQLRQLIRKIVDSTAAVGWRPEDVLLSMVEISWELYEDSRSSRI